MPAPCIVCRLTVAMLRVRCLLAYATNIRSLTLRVPSRIHSSTVCRGSAKYRPTEAPLRPQTVRRHSPKDWHTMNRHMGTKQLHVVASTSAAQATRGNGVYPGTYLLIPNSAGAKATE
eukprot:9492774-Pyramimonas_sp.AAC.1